MMIWLFLLTQLFAEVNQLPEEKFYVPKVDIGYKNVYQTFSLYGTNKYSLTFDDGPHEQYTPLILDLLRAKNVHATFFVVTERITEKTKPILKRMIDEGHTIASHDHQHLNSNLMNEKDFYSLVKKSILLVNEAYQENKTEQEFFYFRFPYAAYGENEHYHHMNVLRELSYDLFQDNCLHFAFWDHDSGDWIPKMTSEEVFQNFLGFHHGGQITTYYVNARKEILKKMETVTSPIGGGVFLFHDIQPITLKAVEKILEQKEALKLEFIPLREINEFQYTTQACRL